MDKEVQANLIFGLQEDKKTKLEIVEDSRFLNTAVIGIKGTRKASYLLPTFAKQDITLGNNIGSTYILNSIDNSYEIYAVARRMKRKTQVEFIKPSSNPNIYNELIEDKPYDYERINKIFDYANMVRTKSIVIIDAEEYKYHELSERFIRKIILHMYLSIQNQKITLGRKHFIYVNSADKYINDLAPILEYGDKFNCATMVFLTARNYLDDKSKMILDTNIRNKILLSNITLEDQEYYKDIIHNNEDILGCPDKLLYSILNDKKTMVTGKCLMASDLKDSDFESFQEVGRRIKKEDTVSDNNIPIVTLTKEFNKLNYSIGVPIIKQVNSNVTNEPIDVIEELPVEKDVKDIIVENIIKSKEPYDGDKYDFTPTKVQQDAIQAKNKKQNKTEDKTVEVLEEKKEPVSNIAEKSAEDAVVENNILETVSDNELKENKDNEVKDIEQPKKEIKKIKKINEINKQKEENKADTEEQNEDIIVKIERIEEVDPFESELNETLERVAERSLLNSNDEDVEEEDYYTEDNDYEEYLITPSKEQIEAMNIKPEIIPEEEEPQPIAVEDIPEDVIEYANETFVENTDSDEDIDYTSEETDGEDKNFIDFDALLEDEDE